jgi:SnoaL-like domain
MATEMIERLRDAQNRHDLDAFVACFHPEYRSEQPVHPGRAFVGSRQVRAGAAPSHRSHPVVAGVVLDLGHAECFEHRRHVVAEPTT